MKDQDPLQTGVRMVVASLPQGGPSTTELLAESCDAVHKALMVLYGDAAPSLLLLQRAVEERVLIWQPPATSLTDKKDHHEWLLERRGDIQWAFWGRYRQYLEDAEELPPSVVTRLDESTDRVLAQLEDPSRGGPWDRRGMVVGQVQSGKTSHYTGLICKAADAGYRLVVVLAGIHNSLRSQTQLRLDQGFLGFDTQYQERSDSNRDARIGAAALPGASRPAAGSLTSSADNGDFNKNKARGMALPVDRMPVLLVVKKNKSILNNLRTWAVEMHGEFVDAEQTRKTVRDLPLLIVDDEADNASINTKSADDATPSEINRQIRLLLDSFEKSAYVGYTATPFANIFSASAEDADHGLDIFPRSFIESLSPPTNYFGPTRVFGIGLEGDEVEPLRIHRVIQDEQSWMPRGHKKHWDPRLEPLPASLNEALLSFVLVCAARRARGQESKHNSMLIHVTHFIDVQEAVGEQISEWLSYTRDRLRRGDGAGSSILVDLEKIWTQDFQSTSTLWSPEVAKHEWEEIRGHLDRAIAKIEVRTVNGTSKDALEYYDHRQHGISVIAIGGNKLSRGLTLEGLSVSYYLRASRMYDTLMQMGRWFGYRPGYEDLCRLYTTSELFRWYREITVASEELREEFSDMAARGANPEAYGLRVRTSPAGLSVTAPNKMRSAGTVTLSFSGDITETVGFDLAPGALDSNLGTLESLVSSIGEDGGEPPEYEHERWSRVPGELVEQFFSKYKSVHTARRARPEFIANYIRDCLKVGELTDWSVILINNPQSRAAQNIQGRQVGMTVRSPLNRETLEADGLWSIRRILSPPHESLDLSNEQKEAAQRAMKEARIDKSLPEPKVPTGRPLRRQRDPSNALLLLYVLDNYTKNPPHEPLAEHPMVGFAVSFPFSSSHVQVTYKVNDIWTLLGMEEMEADADEE